MLTANNSKRPAFYEFDNFKGSRLSQLIFKLQMEKLIAEIYCKASVLATAKSCSSQATHLARRLIEGVAKPAGYLNRTITGQAGRNMKKNVNAKNVKGFNFTARSEIIRK